jgi:hypothetical protein
MDAKGGIIGLSPAGTPFANSPATMKKLFHPMLLLAGLFMLQQSVACSDEPSDTLTAEVDCESYCRQAQMCNGDVNQAECESDCKDALDDCQVDEVDEAQDRLNECAKETCDDFTSCTIDAGAQCYFGL